MAEATLWANELVEASNYTINAGEKTHLLVSSEISNANSPKNSVKAIVEYSGLVPNVTSGYIGFIVEGKDGAGNWHPLVYQFADYRSVGTAGKRILIMQPDMDTFNLGIDDIVFVAGEEEARISREQGSLPTTALRCCVILRDYDPTGTAAFEQVTINATLETYDV